MGMLEPQPRQAEMIEQMIKLFARDSNPERAHVGEVRQAEPTPFVNLPEDHLLIFSVQGPTSPDPALQRPPNTRLRFRMAAQHLRACGEQRQRITSAGRLRAFSRL